jgi:tetratricopeptide (TPR) repeat protein
MLQLIAMTFALTTWAQTPHPGPRTSEQANFLYQEAMDAKKTGKEDLAIEDFRKILSQYPSFKETITVYEQMMEMQIARQNWREAIELGNKAILLNPKGRSYAAIQLLRADAELKAGKPNGSHTIIQELIKAKPDAAILTKALLIKAEALSQLGKHKEAIASLDAARGHDHFPDAELKLRARSCGSKKPEKNSDEYGYFNRKNLCFKESAALAKTDPAKDAAMVWCEQMNQLEEELKKSKIDSFSKQKLEKDIQMTQGLSATWGCK